MNNIVKSALIFAAGIASGVWVSCTIIRRSIEVNFYEICGKESRFTDNNYGWTKNDISKMEIERTRNGYYTQGGVI